MDVYIKKQSHLMSHAFELFARVYNDVTDILKYIHEGFQVQIVHVIFFNQIDLPLQPGTCTKTDSFVAHFCDEINSRLGRYVFVL